MIDGLPIVGIGQSALISLVILLVLTDRLVWHKRLEVLEKQLQAEKEQNAELTKQNTMLLQSAIPTVNAVLLALHDAADDRGPT